MTKIVWKLKVTYCPCKTIIHWPGKGVIIVKSVREGRAPAISNPNIAAVNTAGFFQLIYSLQWVFRLTGQLALLHKTNCSGSMLVVALLCSAIGLQGNSSIHNSVRYKKINNVKDQLPREDISWPGQFSLHSEGEYSPQPPCEGPGSLAVCPAERGPRCCWTATGICHRQPLKPPHIYTNPSFYKEHSSSPPKEDKPKFLPVPPSIWDSRVSRWFTIFSIGSGCGSSWCNHL